MTHISERHNVVRKWKTDFPEGLAPHLYEVEGDKYVWVFVNATQTDEHVRIATLYDGPVYTIEQLLEQEKSGSPDTYQMACEFFAAIDDETILPYWRHDITGGVKCECGSESTYGENATHSDYCPKYVKP